jgi:hypothetical protein
VVDGETGLLVDPEDPDALALALARLLRDPDLRRTLGEAGRRRVECYCTDRVAETFLSAVRSALDGLPAVWRDGETQPVALRLPHGQAVTSGCAGGTR